MEKGFVKNGPFLERNRTSSLENAGYITAAFVTSTMYSTTGASEMQSHRLPDAH